jgi:hypothetical protein
VHALTVVDDDVARLAHHRDGVTQAVRSRVSSQAANIDLP